MCIVATTPITTNIINTSTNGNSFTFFIFIRMCLLESPLNSAKLMPLFKRNSDKSVNIEIAAISSYSSEFLII
jgi:hypothetical protein